MKLILIFFLNTFILAYGNTESNSCDYIPFDKSARQILECSYEGVPLVLTQSPKVILEDGHLCLFELKNGRIILTTKRLVFDSILNQRITDRQFTYNSAVHDESLMFEKEEKKMKSDSSFKLDQKASFLVTPISGYKFWSMQFIYNSASKSATFWRKHYPKGLLGGSDKEESFELNCNEAF